MASGTLSHVSNFLFINEQTDEPPNRRNRIHHVSRSGASHPPYIDIVTMSSSSVYSARCIGSTRRLARASGDDRRPMSS